MNNVFSRRNLLRGAGVALALPWMESLMPRVAGAATGTAPVRYMPIFLPNGAAELWIPNGGGSGAAWNLGSVLSPFLPLKAKVNVLGGMENGSAFNANGSPSVEPSHGRQPGGWLTCVDAATVRSTLKVAEANGVSLDQIMASHAVFAGKTPLASMQVGLSTVYSYCDGQQCSNSRSVSWKTMTQPMYKMVDPLQVFNTITGVASPGGMGTGTPSAPDPNAASRIARKKSVLDSVIENATSTRARLSVGDQARMDEFLTSVRDVEMTATAVSMGMGGVAAGCTIGTKPTMATVTPDGIRQTTATYNKGTHADAMNALIVMALQCDVTRIITYMLEDERSEFTYDQVGKRTFTNMGSTPTTGTCPEYHGGCQHGSQDDFAAVTMWNAQKVADLCTKMDAIMEANGKSILDNSVVFFGAAMHGSDHSCDRIPTALIGSGGGKLKGDQFLALNKRPMRDLHFTMMNSVFGMAQTNFGQNLTGAPIAVINELVAT
jgi:hypothetical protein